MNTPTIDEKLDTILASQRTLKAQQDRMEARLSTIAVPERTIRVHEAAQMLDVSEHTIRGWCASGVMEHSRQGAKGMFRFSIEQLNKMAAKLKGEA